MMKYDLYPINHEMLDHSLKRRYENQSIELEEARKRFYAKD